MPYESIYCLLLKSYFIFSLPDVFLPEVFIERFCEDSTMIILVNSMSVKPVQMLEGVTMRMVIGPDQGAPHFNLRVFEVEPGASTP